MTDDYNITTEQQAKFNTVRSIAMRGVEIQNYQIEIDNQAAQIAAIQEVWDIDIVKYKGMNIDQVLADVSLSDEQFDKVRKCILKDGLINLRRKNIFNQSFCQSHYDELLTQMDAAEFQDLLPQVQAADAAAAAAARGA